MKSNISNLRDYFYQLVDSLKPMPLKELDTVIEALALARDSDRVIYVMGNGGSASTASHFTCDLGKGAIQAGKQGFKIFCLNDNIPTITAWANDTDYDNIFAGQIESFVNPKDVVIAISVGGNSPNVVKGIQAAKLIGAYCISFVGSGEGKLKTLSDVTVVVPNDNTEQVEDLHLIICHAIKTCLRQFE